MTESLADRFIQWQRRVSIHNDTFETLVNEVRVLTAENANRKALLSTRDAQIACFQKDEKELKADNAELKKVIGIMVDESKGYEGGLLMTKSLVHRIELLSSINLTERYELANGVRTLAARLAEYKYTPQAYDEMWKRVKKTVNENDELKACITEFKAGIAELETRR